MVDPYSPQDDKSSDYLLPKEEAALLKRWIAEGADWPKDVTLSSQSRTPQTVDFKRHIKPTLEQNCLKCHWERSKKGKLRHRFDAFGAGGEVQALGQAVNYNGDRGIRLLFRSVICRPESAAAPTGTLSVHP